MSKPFDPFLENLSDYLMRVEDVKVGDDFATAIHRLNDAEQYVERYFKTQRQACLKHQIALDKGPRCVHTEHCCVIHGCKYGNEECPVVLGISTQSYMCEECQQ
jgi:hypothetical protein